MNLDEPGRVRWRFLHFNELSLIVAILVVIGITTLLDSQHAYLSEPETSARNIVRRTALLGIFSLGAAVVIIAGGIDLSSGSMIAFSGTMCATFMVLLAPEKMAGAQPLGLRVIALSIAGTLGVGFLVGTLHAWLISIVRLPPFIATLGTLVGLRSLARAICAKVTGTMLDAPSTQIQIFDDQFRYLANSVWIPCVIFLVLACAIGLMLSRTVVGRHVYALGGNEQAARLSGIRTERVKWLAYTLGAMTATIAGILYIGEQSTADPQTLAVGYELNAIAAAVVGGCSLQGGIGTASGTVLGALFLQTVIDAVAKIIKADADTYEGLIVGLVLVTAAALSQLRQRGAGGREAFGGWLGTFAIIALAMLGGTLAALLTGSATGMTTAVATLIFLAAVKIWQRRRVAVPVEA